MKVVDAFCMSCIEKGKKFLGKVYLCDFKSWKSISCVFSYINLIILPSQSDLM